MLSDIAIKIDNLTKYYHMYSSPRDRLKQFLVSTLPWQSRKRYYREFGALTDVSFKIRKGETVGIIGTNGSGKSTLLQMICGILTPTSGNIITNGRIAALLELGSGFNPEFTGRENIYLNASLLGLSRGEIEDRFKDIVAFADIGEYLDQPVKTYSSGMYVRLAFSVIAHVDSDVLVIDEALSVGDAIFTQKCMRFIRNFCKKGTLLFVSHDTNSVINLCEHVVWLDKGKLVEQGDANKIVGNYLHYNLQQIYGDEAKLESLEIENNKITMPDFDTSREQINPDIYDYKTRYDFLDNLNRANGWKTGHGEILSVNVINLSKSNNDVFQGGEYVQLIIRAIAYKKIKQPILGFLLRDRLGQDLFGENTLPFSKLNPVSFETNDFFEARYEFMLPMLPNGQYVLMASLADGDYHNNVQHHWLHDALVLNISSSQVRYGLVGLSFQNITLQKI